MAVQASIQHGRHDSGVVHGESPSWFADERSKASVAPDARLAHSMVASGCTVGSSRVSMSTLLKGAKIGQSCNLVSCLIGQNAVIGDGCELDGVVVDHSARVPDGTQQRGGTWPRSE